MLQEFTCELDRMPTDEDLDALFEAGLDDSTPEIVDGRGILHVARQEESLPRAIQSAVRDIEATGLRVVALEDEDLVGLRTIADRFSRTYESVRLLSRGRRGPGGFPPAISRDGWELYSWASVAQWGNEHLGLDIEIDGRERVIAAADHLLRARAILPDIAELAALVRR